MSLQDVMSGCVWSRVHPAKSPQVPLLGQKIQRLAYTVSKNWGTGGSQQCAGLNLKIHTHSLTLTLTLMCADTLTLIGIHTLTHSPMHNHARTRECIRELTCVCRQTHTCRLAQSDAHMCMCTYRHTPLHAHTHAQTRRMRLSSPTLEPVSPRTRPMLPAVGDRVWANLCPLPPLEEDEIELGDLQRAVLISGSEFCGPMDSGSTDATTKSHLPLPCRPRCTRTQRHPGMWHCVPRDRRAGPLRGSRCCLARDGVGSLAHSLLPGVLFPAQPWRPPSKRGGREGPCGPGPGWGAGEDAQKRLGWQRRGDGGENCRGAQGNWGALDGDSVESGDCSDGCQLVRPCWKWGGAPVSKGLFPGTLAMMDGHDEVVKILYLEDTLGNRAQLLTQSRLPSVTPIT